MPNQNTLDNPNDIALREQSRQQRLAQGKADAARREQEKNVGPAKYYEPFTFRFRKIKPHPSFGGLWELAVLKKDGKVEEIIKDADALPECLDAISNIFANKGY